MECYLIATTGLAIGQAPGNEWKIPILPLPSYQGLNQDLETGCPKLTIVKYLGVLFHKGENNILS